MENFKLDLQLFNDEETTETTEVEEIVEQVEETENTEPNSTETEEQTEETQSEKTFTQSELDSIVQKRIERERKSIENDERITFLNELAEQQGVDSKQFIETIKKEREQQKLNELVEQNIPEEYAKEMLENRKFREEYTQQQEYQKTQQVQEQQVNQFLEYFQEVNGRSYNPETDGLTQETQDKINNGMPIMYAYMEQRSKELTEQLSSVKQETEQETIKKLNQNNSTSPGSVSTGGDPQKKSVWEMSEDEFNAYKEERRRIGG